MYEFIVLYLGNEENEEEDDEEEEEEEEIVDHGVNHEVVELKHDYTMHDSSNSNSTDLIPPTPLDPPVLPPLVLKKKSSLLSSLLTDDGEDDDDHDGLDNNNNKSVAPVALATTQLSNSSSLTGKSISALLCQDATQFM